MGRYDRHRVRVAWHRMVGLVRERCTEARCELWTPYRTDEDWELVFHWERTSTILGTSEVRIVWEIPVSVEKGIYRIRYFGDSKALGGKISPFEGESGRFNVV